MRIEDRTAMDQWLTSIVNRKLVDAMRKAHTKKRGGDYEQIRETSTTSSFSGVLGLLMSRERTPSQAVSKKEASRAIRVALRGLNRERRQAVRLRYIKGLGPKEIALRMGKTTPAVSTLLFNALRELRERLGHAAKFFTDARSQDGDAEDQAGAEGASETARAAS
jgi:RNA polymerase sigma factor (sigma-70 family)